MQPVTDTPANNEREMLSLLSARVGEAALHIDEARSMPALTHAAQRVDALVVLLHDSGQRVERVAHLVGDLNRRLFAKLWSMVAPQELIANSCLIVMGSEGRGEQI